MNENEIITVQETSDSLMSLDYDNVIALADRADKMVGALNKIMQAAIKITTAKDWVLIAGTPYLQEAGASKVARLFGICWQICDGYPKQELNKDGYPTFTYRMVFTMGNQSITAEGMRNAADEFFTGKSKKSVDEIDIADVKRAAYTNCLNRGIKGILPGLRNLDVSDLEAAGLDMRSVKGYTFKSGSRGGNTGKAEDSGIVCEVCGAAITQKVASYSESKYGKKLCMDCQKKATAGGEKKTGRGKKQEQDVQEEDPSDNPFDAPDEYFDSLVGGDL